MISYLAIQWIHLGHFLKIRNDMAPYRPNKLVSVNRVQAQNFLFLRSVPADSNMQPTLTNHYSRSQRGHSGVPVLSIHLFIPLRPRMQTPALRQALQEAMGISDRHGPHISGVYSLVGIPKSPPLTATQVVHYTTPPAPFLACTDTSII